MVFTWRFLVISASFIASESGIKVEEYFECRETINQVHLQISKKIRFSLTVLLMGVGIATVTDLQLNMLGSVLSLLAVLTTCVAQIMTNTIQKKYKVSSTQLLYQSCPYLALTLFIVGPFLDALLTNKNVFAFKYTPLVLGFIVLSCMISVSVNFSTFLVIGKTSPVTYQASGSGFAWFSQPVFQRCLDIIHTQQLAKVDPATWPIMISRVF
ncbi:unnamed protein product [Lactuca virosa]|uniref:WAT1-related protein n=1 Tax=Lactuca virosa TaxID=75947 RepID=A0AAU9NUV0_9ASTR|nr:unnamed protein product [Lactuca virosa]